jgi:hypothetical protein
MASSSMNNTSVDYNTRGEVAAKWSNLANSQKALLEDKQNDLKGLQTEKKEIEKMDPENK